MRWCKGAGPWLAVGMVFTMSTGGAEAIVAQEVVELTLESMTELALTDSYRVRQLNLSIERTRQSLRAEQARLKSSVQLELDIPRVQYISDYQYNSVLQRNELVREDSRRWEADLSIRQPVVLFGYPTDGYLSLNNRVYRYLQNGQDGTRDVRYYNRYFISYDQPLFQPNRLKNALEQAELNLERNELEFGDDVVDMVRGLSYDYFELFEVRYEEDFTRGYVSRLESAVVAADGLAANDSTRLIEADQIRVELANAEEELQQSLSEYRLQSTRLRQNLRLDEGVVLEVDAVIQVDPIQVDEDAAIRFAQELSPTLRQLGINRRRNEISLENTKARNAFRMDLRLSYGREMQDPIFSNLWQEPSNSYTIDLNAYVPIWDWGERDARIQAQRIGLEQTDLRIEEIETDIRSRVGNTIQSVVEYQNRALAMEENLSLAREVSARTLERYQEGQITALDLLQTFQRERDTAENLLDAYLGWRRSLLQLEELTFFDFRRGVPLLERYGVRGT